MALDKLCDGFTVSSRVANIKALSLHHHAVTPFFLQKRFETSCELHLALLAIVLLDMPGEDGKDGWTQNVLP